VFQDLRRDLYAKLVLSDDGRRLVGGILVGDASQYPRLLQLARDGREIPESADELLFGSRGGAAGGAGSAADAQVCSCNNVGRGALCQAIPEGGLDTIAGVKKATRAGTGAAAASRSSPRS
jgi:nitrite reductase (NADH) large subunit